MSTSTRTICSICFKLEMGLVQGQFCPSATIAHLSEKPRLYHIQEQILTPSRSMAPARLRQTVMWAVVLLVALMVLKPVASNERLEPEEPEGQEETVNGLTFRYTRRCSRKADVLFLLDSSTSVKDWEYAKMKSFVANLVASFPIGPYGMYFAAIVYSNNPVIGFHFKPYWGGRRNLIYAIMNLPRLGGKTYTGKALNLARKEFIWQGARHSIHKIAVVFTDGRSTDDENTKIQAAKLKESGVNVIAIGIGHRIDHSELRAIASNPRLVFYADDFDSLYRILNTVGNMFCTVCQSHNLIL